MPPPVAILDVQKSGVLRSYVERDPSGSTNFCSWQRLAEELRTAGCVRADEEIVAFVITDRGLEIRLRIR